MGTPLSYFVLIWFLVVGVLWEFVRTLLPAAVSYINLDKFTHILAHYRYIYTFR